jgi:hypothetical protein
MEVEEAMKKFDAVPQEEYERFNLAVRNAEVRRICDGKKPAGKREYYMTLAAICIGLISVKKAYEFLDAYVDTR